MTQKILVDVEEIPEDRCSCGGELALDGKNYVVYCTSCGKES